MPIAEPTAVMPTAVIYDLDGTLADVIPFRHYVQRPPGEQDGEAFHTAGTTIARPIPQAVQHLEAMRAAGHVIIVVSGRATKWLEPSADWLRANGIHYDHLWVRPEGFTGNDIELKAEIHRRHIQGRFRVVHVLDDQPRIAALWETFGYEVTLIPGWTDADEESMGYPPDLQPANP
jgi:hypothetical protein